MTRLERLISRRVIIFGVVSLLCMSGFLRLRLLAEQRPRILLFGDSLCSNLCEFYPAMQREFPQAEIIPGGVVGATTWQRAAMLPQPKTWIDRPDLMIVLMGVNNFGHDHTHPPAWGWADLERIRVQAHAASVPVFIGTPLTYLKTFGSKPCSPTWSADYVAELRELILKLSQPDVIDFDEAIPPQNAEPLFVDCLHPNAAGGQRMAALVRTTICKRQYRSAFAPLCTVTRPTGSDAP